MLSQSRDLFERIAINTQNKSVFISIKDILYLKSDNNYTAIYMEEAEKLPQISSKNLGHYEDLLSNHPFCRIHNSYLVNLKKVVKYHKGKAGEVELTNGMRLEISLRRKDEVLAKLGLG
jgi:two-component system, LytTR family, response regulator